MLAYNVSSCTMQKVAPFKSEEYERYTTNQDSPFDGNNEQRNVTLFYNRKQGYVVWVLASKYVLVLAIAAGKERTHGEFIDNYKINQTQYEDAEKAASKKKERDEQ